MAEHLIDLSQDMDPELYQEFLTDSHEHLAAIEQGILSMEADPDDRGAVDNVFRAFHTFKGNAGFLGLEPIAELAHRLESLLESVRSGDMAADSNVVNLILSGGDALEKYVSTISDQVTGKVEVVPFSYDNSALISELDRILLTIEDKPVNEMEAAVEPNTDDNEKARSLDSGSSSPGESDDSATQNEIHTQDLNHTSDEKESGNDSTEFSLPEVEPIENPEKFLNDEDEQELTKVEIVKIAATDKPDDGETAEILTPQPAKVPKTESQEPKREVAGRQNPGSDEPAGSVQPAQQKSSSAERVNSGEHSSSVKVATHKLDSLVDMVGEFVIAQSQVMQSMRTEGDVGEEVARNLVQLSRISKDLQRTAMSLRMVPIRNTFQKMNRLVRDVASKQGKKVQLILEGEETEIDRNIVEAIHDPLVHMIRNSVDHGIESSESRTNAGKSAEGTIILRAYHQAGNIRIEICDDGAGLDRNRILDKAISKKLIEPGVEMSDSDVFNLIFTPGFSTAEKITDISGRGVGMDVVKRNITKLRGKIEITSEKGRGSTFVISLPLTLAIIEGLQVRIGAHCYIIPVSSVIESFRLKSGVITTVQGRGQLIRVRDQQIPMLDLRDYFHINGTDNDLQERVVIILESENQKRCVVVDELLGKNEVVIKNLGNIFATDPAISGATILGDGMVGLILEPSVLVRLPAAA